MEDPVQIDPDVMLPDFIITGYSVHDCTVTYVTGKANFSFYVTKIIVLFFLILIILSLLPNHLSDKTLNI